MDNQDRKKKIARGRLKISDLKSIEPLVDSYEFKTYNLYLFIVKPPSTIIGGTKGLNPETIPKLKEILNESRIRHAFIMDDGTGLKIFELKPEGDERK